MLPPPPPLYFGAWWVGPNRPDVLQRHNGERYPSLRVAIMPDFVPSLDPEPLSAVSVRVETLDGVRIRARHPDTGRNGDVLVYAVDAETRLRAGMAALMFADWPEPPRCAEHDDCRQSAALARACWESRQNAETPATR